MPQIKTQKIFIVALLSVIAIAIAYKLNNSTLLKGRAASGPVQVQNLTDNKNSYSGGQIPKYSKYELSFTLSATYSNPFAPYGSGNDATGAKADSGGASIEGVFQAPSGEKRIVAFCYDNCGANQTAQWKIRFTPTETGNHSYYIRIVDRNGTSTSDSGSFSVTNSNNPGFLRTNGRFFQFDNGTTFVPRGHHHQKTTSTSVIDDYYNYAKNTGMVSQHIWAHPDATCLEWISNGKCGLSSSSALGRYDTNAIKPVDRFFENTGMYYILGQDDMILYGTGASSHLTWNYNPYRNITGQSQVFTNAEAKAYYKRRLRYIIARWGYSPNLFAWELLSEIDWPFQSEGIWSGDDLVNWHNEMANYLHAHDPNDHLVTTNTAVSLNGVTNSNDYRYRMYRLPGIDFTAHNIFYGPNEMQYANMTMDRIFQYVGTNKPFIIGSWGISNNSFQDTGDSLAMHNVIWVSAMRAGTTQHHWYWSNYRSNNGTRHYLYLANFLQGEDFIRDGLVPDKEFSTSTGSVETYALASNRKVLGWAHDTGSNYSSQTNTNRSGVNVTLTGLTNGTYTVEYWNTWQGTRMSQTAQSVSNGTLTLTLPSFSRDMAFKAYIPGSTPLPTISPTGSPTPTPPTTFLDPVSVSNPVNGLGYRYYEGSFSDTLPNFGSLTPVETGVVTAVELSPRNREDQFAFVFEGYVNVPAQGVYTFYTSSDDQAKLTIGGQQVTLSNWNTGEVSGTIGLKAGYHTFKVEYVENDADNYINISWSGPSVTKTALPTNRLFRHGNATSSPTPTTPPPTGSGNVNLKVKFQGISSLIRETLSLKI